MRILPMLPLIAALIYGGSSHLSAQANEPGEVVRNLMSADEFRAAGLNRLAEEERIALDMWYMQMAIRLVALGTAPRANGGDLTEAEVEDFFRRHTVMGNHAAAIKIRFTIPQPGTAYLGTIHGYPNNLTVCEELIEPYNDDPALTTIPGGRYFCEALRW